ncbi:MAG: hypothetical protein K1Y36_20340 [Blastocatellia bacterium]|nr:hypothetical protein [Blastocatellia bacterium]
MKHCLMSFICLLCIAQWLPIATAQVQIQKDPRPVGTEQELLQVLKDIGCGEAVNDKQPEEVAGPLRRSWNLVGAWTAAYLNTHPQATERELSAALLKLLKTNCDFDESHVSAAQLSSGNKAAFAVAVNWIWIGTFFVVAKDAGGKFQFAWNIKDVAEKNFASRNELGYWAFGRAGIHDGPLTGDVHPLPPGKSGNPRFWVDGVSRPAMGLSKPGQISVWEWDGKTAQSLFIKTYNTHEEWHQVRFQSGNLVIHAVEEAKTYYFCGSCETIEPRSLWTLAITPEGVQDKGRTYVIPELDFVDRLIFRFCVGENVSDAAAPTVIQKLKKLFPKPKSGKKLDYPLAMISVSPPSRQGNRTVLKLNSDELGECTFTILNRNGKYVLTALRTED